MTTDPQRDPLAILERMRQDSIRIQEEFADWMTVQQIPRTTHCRLHDVHREVDPEESIRNGLRAGGKFAAVYKPCPKCAANEIMRKRSEYLRKQGVEDLNILHATFENFVCHTANDRSNLEKAMAFANNKRGFIHLSGPVGTGKSHLAVAMMRAMDVKSARFITHSRMLRVLRDEYGKREREDIIEKVSSIKLLVLDDLGISAGGRDDLPMLHEVLDTRHGRRHPTILTSNLNDEELLQTVGKRVFDRMDQNGFGRLVFTGESNRRKYRDLYYE